MIKKRLSKKFIVKGVATTLVVLLPFSFVKPKETKAVVGVDDAILFTVLGLGAVTSIGAAYGMSKSGIFEKVSSSLSNDLQEIGNGWKTIENAKAFAKSTTAMLPDILDTFKNLEGSTYEENVIPSGDYYYISNSVGKHYFYWLGGDLRLPFPYARSVPAGIVLIEVTPNDVYIKQNNSALSSSGIAFCEFPLKVDKSKVKYAYDLASFPPLSDVTNEPTSISLDKSFVDSVAATYAEQNPEDNNGDKNVDYSTLIPLFFDMLEKKLGDGTITPVNLSNNGVSSYVYKDGSVQGQNPYNFQNLGDNNINVEQNVNINNGSEVTEEEKNGILNILDNGVRKTTTLLNNLKNSMAGLGDTLQGLFNFLPEPVGYLFYSALCLSLIFFILSLRR